MDDYLKDFLRTKYHTVTGDKLIAIAEILENLISDYDETPLLTIMQSEDDEIPMDEGGISAILQREALGYIALHDIHMTDDASVLAIYTVLKMLYDIHAIKGDNDLAHIALNAEVEPEVAFLNVYLHIYGEEEDETTLSRNAFYSAIDRVEPKILTGIALAVSDQGIVEPMSIPPNLMAFMKAYPDSMIAKLMQTGPEIYIGGDPLLYIDTFLGDLENPTLEEKLVTFLGVAAMSNSKDLLKTSKVLASKYLDPSVLIRTYPRLDAMFEKIKV